MGLDGISINQLRITPDKDVSDYNAFVRLNSNGEVKAVDGLERGRRVDPDKEKEQENREFDDGLESEQEETSATAEVVEPIVKYDLSENEKYKLKLDEDTKQILIIEKKTSKVVQKFDAQLLSQFVNNLCAAQGAMYNRKL